MLHTQTSHAAYIRCGCDYAAHDWKRVTVAIYPFFITCWSMGREELPMSDQSDNKQIDDTLRAGKEGF